MAKFSILQVIHNSELQPHPNKSPWNIQVRSNTPSAFLALPNPTPTPTVKDIRHVLRSLTQGSPSEQHDAVTRYFTPSASFIHPFCRVPSFSDTPVPFSGGLSLNSRTLILAIYKWYKILSPRIDIEIESTGTSSPPFPRNQETNPPPPQKKVFDQRANLLYLTAHQTFSLWFLPFYQARAVRLVTVLHLVPEPLLPNGVDHHSPSPSATTTPLGEAPEEPTFAEVASAAVDTSDVVDAATGKPERRLAQPASNTAAVSVGGGGGRRYRIDKQEDLYQVNEFLKFVAMTPGAVVFGWWQVFSTVLCLLGVLLLGPVVRVLGLEGQQAAGRLGAGQKVGEKR